MFLSRVARSFRQAHLGPAAFTVLLVACSGAPPALRTPTPSVGAAAPTVGSEPAPAVSSPPASEPRAPEDVERARLVSWLESRLPEGGAVVDKPGEAVGVVHTFRAADTLPKIAADYVALTEIYLTRDFLKVLSTAHVAAPKVGDRIVIPEIVARAPKEADAERLGWPEDHALRGLYVRGSTAATPLFTGLLGRMADRGMNVIVLDAKDYDGLVTYRSKIPLVVETGAAANAPIHDLARTIRFAHAKSIRVAMRISCFEDEFMAKAKPELAIVSKWKRPYRIGWLDPANQGARAYILDMVKEAMDAGVDEIQLDYIRYPVLGIKGADFDATKGSTKKTIVIRDFVRAVHALTKARNVPLSLDIFGIVAEGQAEDIDMLGQDPALLAAECEALSPMVYPSHYNAGYYGFEIPGNHPEIVGIGTKKILEQIRKYRSRVVVRPWLQAVDYRSPEYGPQYLASEVKHATSAGSTGWLMWNPAQTYTVAWTAIPRLAAR
jgi:hypothetical protein